MKVYNTKRLLLKIKIKRQQYLENLQKSLEALWKSFLTILLPSSVSLSKLDLMKYYVQILKVYQIKTTYIAKKAYHVINQIHFKYISTVPSCF